jgi:predicted RNA binding protein YcfA (HicA-like mRNA interferase family)
MSLPLLSGREIARQKGSHIILVKEGHIATLSVPNHKEVAKGTLRKLITRAGITVEEFMEAMK